MNEVSPVLTDLGVTNVRPHNVGRVVTATIALVCVLIVYDGWGNLRLRDAVAIVVGPVIADVLSHDFASTLVMHMELGRRPTYGEWFATGRRESYYLLLAVPPVVILVVLDLFGVSIADSMRVVISCEALSLSLWAGLAARRAGLRGRSFALALLSGFVATCIVLTLQIVLKPNQG